MPRKSSQGASRRAPKPPNFFFGGPGACRSVLAAFRRCPRDVRGTIEAAQKPPSNAQGVPKSASGTPKTRQDRPGQPRIGSSWAEGLLDSSSALLQKSSFYGIKSQVLEVPGTPEPSRGALGSVAVVSFGASLRRNRVFGSKFDCLRSVAGPARRRDVVPRQGQGPFPIFLRPSIV